jgi:hypothetical protein
MKRAIAIACVGVGLLSSVGAMATTAQGYSGDRMPKVTDLPLGAIQLAGSFHNSPAKLNDKYLAGKSGGWYGIGGPESKIVKKKKKIVPCCSNSKP